jgi:hypothetical protein
MNKNRESYNKLEYHVVFESYKSINCEPYYVFLLGKTHHLVSCRNYPDLIGSLVPFDRVRFTAEKEEPFATYGIELKAVEFKL